MSNFSERLREIISDAGISQNMLSQRADIDRTTLNKVLQGIRLPSEAFVSRLCNALRLTPKQAEELNILFEIEKVGKDVYERNNMIKETIETLALLEKPQKNGVAVRKDVVLPDSITQNEVSVFNGSLVVNNLLRDVVEAEFYGHENPCISVFCPMECEALYSAIFQVFSVDSERLSVEQIVRFDTSSGDAATRNIRIMKNCLPLAMTSGSGYRVYYYFSGFDFMGEINTLMPFYVILSDCVVSLSNSFDSAVVCTNSDYVELCRREFERLKSGCRPLITRFMTIVDMVDHEIEAGTNGERSSYMIYAEPLICKVYDGEQILDHRIRGIPGIEELADRLRKSFAVRFSHPEFPKVQYFSADGMWSFVRSGYSAEFPQEMVVPFTLEERLIYVEKYIKLVSEGMQVRAINPSMFTIPRVSYIEYVEGTALTVSIYCPNKGGTRLIVLTEPSILGAFQDSMDNIDSTPMICSKEETIALFVEAREYLLEEMNKQN